MSSATHNTLLANQKYSDLQSQLSPSSREQSVMFKSRLWSCSVNMAPMKTVDKDLLNLVECFHFETLYDISTTLCFHSERGGALYTSRAFTVPDPNSANTRAKHLCEALKCTDPLTWQKTSITPPVPHHHAEPIMLALSLCKPSHLVHIRKAMDDFCFSYCSLDLSLPDEKAFEDVSQTVRCLILFPEDNYKELQRLEIKSINALELFFSAQMRSTAFELSALRSFADSYTRYLGYHPLHNSDCFDPRVILARMVLHALNTQSKSTLTKLCYFVLHENGVFWKRLAAVIEARLTTDMNTNEKRAQSENLPGLPLAICEQVLLLTAASVLGKDAYETAISTFMSRLESDFQLPSDQHTFAEDKLKTWIYRKTLKNPGPERSIDLVLQTISYLNLGMIKTDHVLDCFRDLVDSWTLETQEDERLALEQKQNGDLDALERHTRMTANLRTCIKHLNFQIHPDSSQLDYYRESFQKRPKQY